MASKNRLIYGALIGDYGGSIYHGSSSIDKKLQLMSQDVYTPESHYTDDTVMTVALAHALYYRTDITVAYRYFASRYPSCGYGNKFLAWVWDDDKKAYGSKGMGAAMRVSPVAYFAQDEEDCKEKAKKSAAITHNSEEGIHSAITAALMVYYALHGKEKEFLTEVAEEAYPGCSSFDLEKLHREARFSPLAEDAMPLAMYAFLSSKDMSDCLHRVCYIGGDSDSIGAVACAIASAFYKKVPAMLLIPVLDNLPSEFSFLLDNIPLPIDVGQEGY